MFGSVLREKLDKVYDPHGISISIYVLWDWVRLEYHCHILWISSCYSLWYYGGCLCNLGIYFFPSSTSWYSCWKKLEWCPKQPMPCEDHSSSNSWKKMVPHPICCLNDGRATTFRQHIHWDVFCLHFLLELQGKSLHCMKHLLEAS